MSSCVPQTESKKLFIDSAHGLVLSNFYTTAGAKADS